MNDLIQASTVRIKSMADGSLDLTVRIEPKDMIAACTLFGAPGLPIVLARLVMEHEKPKAETRISVMEEKQEDKSKGGPAAQWLGARCNEQIFRDFLHFEKNYSASNPEEAAIAVRHFCGVKSRADIDHDDTAKAAFMKLRQDYMNWSGR